MYISKSLSMCIFLRVILPRQIGFYSFVHSFPTDRATGLIRGVIGPDLGTDLILPGLYARRLCRLGHGQGLSVIQVVALVWVNSIPFVVIIVSDRDVSDGHSEEPIAGVSDLMSFREDLRAVGTHASTNPKKMVNPPRVHPRPEQTFTLIQFMTIRAIQKTTSTQLRIMTALMLYHRRHFSIRSVPIM